MTHVRKTLLVIEDEAPLLELLELNLTREGYAVLKAATGGAGLELARAGAPDLILLDLMLPDIDGLDVCRRLKRDGATEGIPVVMLTARDEEADVVAGLELGADDYLVKPFSLRVLAARVRTVLRRRDEERLRERSADRRSAGGLTLDARRRECLAGDVPVELTSTEFNMLWLLATRPGTVFTRSQILEAVRGSDSPATERTVDVRIVGLRRKLGETSARIETIRGVGYRLRE